LHMESDPARDQGRLGKLGQTGTHRQRARAGVIFAMLIATAVCSDRILLEAAPHFGLKGISIY